MEKSIIQGEVKGNFTLTGIENALRAHWADDAIKKRDGEGRHSSLFQGEDDDEEYEMPLDEADAFYEGWTEREKAWYQEAKEDEQHAWLQMQGAKRTMKEARARQREVKMTRKFYKSYPILSGGRSTSYKNDKEKGPCFKCGERGHHKRECPKRESAKMATHYEEDEEAQYTYHTTEEEQVPDFPDGGQEEFPEGNFYGMDGSSGLEPMPVFQASVSTEKAVLEKSSDRRRSDKNNGLSVRHGAVHEGNERATRNRRRQAHRSQRRRQANFGFGNSQKAKCLSTCVLKLPHEDRPMQLKVHVLGEGKAPVLLSVDTLRKMGAIIDVASDEVIFSQVAPDKLIKLERSGA